MTKIKKAAIKILAFALSLILGGALGYMTLDFIEKSGISNVTAVYFTGILCIVFALVLQIAVHELGHMVGGILSGYQFLSYRIFNIMLVKENGKFAFKKLKLAGTGGQCLMAPPNKNYNEIPYFLYNFMGGGANIIAGALCLLLLPLAGNVYLTNFLFLTGVLGLFLAGTNLIPLNIGMNNDGMNILQIRKSESAKEAFFKQMQTAACLAKGLRVKDFPKELFEVAPASEKQDALSAACRVNYCLKLLDEQNYSAFISETDELIQNNNAILDIHKMQLLNSKIFCAIMLSQGEESIKKLMNSQYKKTAKAMGNMPEFLRTAYALAKHINKDEKQEAKREKMFYKALKNYPYKGEVITENMLFNDAKNLERHE